MSQDFEPMVPSPRLPDTPEAEVPQSLTYPFWNYEDLLLFFGMGLPCLVLSIALMQGITWVLHVKPGKAVYTIVAQFFGYAMWFASLFFLLRVRYEAPFWESLAWVFPKSGLKRSVLAGPLLAFTVTGLAWLLRMPEIQSPFHDLLSDRWSLIVMGLFGVTIGPFCEELAFRGFMMPVLNRSFGTWIGVIITAIPFALLHGPQYDWSWRHLVLLVLAGIAFGVVRMATGSTAAATLTHATYNLTFFSAQIVQGNL